MIARRDEHDGSSRWRHWLPLIIAASIYTIAMCIVVWLRAETSTDFRDFWQTALHFRQTGTLSTELGVHNYLPFFTIFMTPWSYLPLRIAIVLFTILSLGLFAITTLLVEVLLVGEIPVKPRRAYLVAIGLMLPYVTSCAVLGAVGLLLLFLITATWFLIQTKREWLAGAALGLAIIIKLLPAALLACLLLQRRPRPIVTALAVSVGLGIGTPLMLLGAKATVEQHRRFVSEVVFESGARATIFAERPRKANFSNSALPIVLRRLLSPVNGAKVDNEVLRVNVADFSRNSIFIVYLVLIGGIVLASAVASLRVPSSCFGTNYVFGAWCCVMLLGSPLVWTHYLPLVYLPLALLAHAAEASGARVTRTNRIALVTLLIWLIGALLLALPVARAAGAQLAAVLCLWIGTLYLTDGRPSARQIDARPT